MEDRIRVQDYFEDNSAAFDGLYSKERSWFLRLFDACFRRDIIGRFILTMEETDGVRGKTILDVGCGPGRYSVALAKKGALSVTGLDFSENMLELAKGLAGSSGVEGVCEFIKSDFMAFHSPEKFDISIAIGVFDYVRDAGSFLSGLKKMTKEKIIVSFPKNSLFRSTQRKIRYWLKGCPVFFYKKSDIEKLMKLCGFDKFSLTQLQGDWFVVMEVK